MSERMGTDRAAALLAELHALGLRVIDAEELADLERRASGYDRMRALVDGED